MLRAVFNLRLSAAMVAQRLTFGLLAEKVGVARSTVERWYYEGRIPRGGHRARAAEALGVSATWLWPTASPDRPPPSHRGRDVIEIFTQAGDLPPDFLPKMVGSAARELFVCTDSEWFLDMLGFSHETAAAWADTRLDVRIVLPTSMHWPAWQHLAFTGIELQVTDQPPHASLIKADDSMLVISGGVGLNTASTPALLLSRLTTGGAFDGYAAGFENLWLQSTLVRVFGDTR